MILLSNPKFICPMHSEAKQTEIVGFGAKKLVFVEEVPTLKMGFLDSSQIHPTGWPGCKGFKSKSKGGGGWYVISAPL